MRLTVVGVVVKKPSVFRERSELVNRVFSKFN